MKINKYDKILLNNGKTATVIEILKEDTEYLVDVDLAGPDWDTIEIGSDDIKCVI
jgi:HSP20 family molecular chaperone IbpA